MEKENKKQIFVEAVNNYKVFEMERLEKIKTYSKTFNKDFSDDFECTYLWDSLVSITQLTTKVTKENAIEWLKWYFEERIESGSSKVVLSDHSEWDCSNPDIFYEMLWESHKLENLNNSNV